MAQRLALYALAYVVIAALGLLRASGVRAVRVEAEPSPEHQRLSRWLPSLRGGFRWRDTFVHSAAILGVLALSPALLGMRLGPPPSDAQAAPSLDMLTVSISPNLPNPFSALEPAGNSPSAPGGPSLAVPIVSAQTTSPDADQEQPTTPPAATDEAADAKPTIPARYTVQAGDTVKKIAARFDLSVDTVIAANALGSGDYIQVGQQLWLQQPDAATLASIKAADPHEAFIQNLARGAQESQRRYGVPASVTLAQAILETYWGTSYLAREANNYFGIKAYGKSGTDGVLWMDAWEVDGAGRNVTSSEPFRRYADPGESLVDHGLFFVENHRYARALEAGDDPREFARRINAAGYATDPAYAAKLISYMDRYNLYQWDVTP